MNRAAPDGWLTPDTFVYDGNGTAVPIGRLVDARLGPPTGRPEEAPGTGEILAFDLATGRIERRRVVAVHRRSASDTMCRVQFGSGDELTVAGRVGLLTLSSRGIGIRPVAELTPGCVCLTPRLRQRDSAADVDLSIAAGRTLGRAVTPLERAAGTTSGPVHLPLRVDATLAWLIGTTLAQPRGRAAAELAALVADAQAAVFCPPGRRPAEWRHLPVEHPTVRRFLDMLELSGPVPPSWLARLPHARVADLLSGLLDGAGTIRPAHREITLRIPATLALRLRLLLRSHGLLADMRPDTAGRCLLVLAHRDAITTAQLLRLRRPRLAALQHRLLARGTGRGPTLGAQPVLVATLLDELNRAGAGGRMRAARVLADTLGISERSFYDLLAGRRGLHWEELACLTHLHPRLGGPVTDAIRAVPLTRFAPTFVTGVERRAGAGSIYAVTTTGSGSSALLAGGFVVRTDGHYTSTPGYLTASRHDGSSSKVAG